jgi:hypothetical protein
MKSRKAERKIAIDALKCVQGCEVCGFRQCAAALHYHHRDPSTKAFSVASHNGKPWPVIKAEIDKCDVLCGIHHPWCHALMRDGMTYDEALAWLHREQTEFLINCG